MVAQASKNMTSAQKLKQQKLMGADVSDPSSSEDECSREKAAKNAKGCLELKRRGGGGGFWAPA